MRPRTVIVTLVGVAAAGPVPVIHQRAVAVPQDGGFGPFSFTSTYNLVAMPERVVNADNVPTPGEAGSMGFYNYGINSELDIICYNITLMGVTGPYSSPAVTATHIHEAAEGQNGPPRIAFPNPEPANSGPEVVKRSAGCIQGPFLTGIQAADGLDTGAGFRVAQIEANPAAFFTDSHTAVSVPGVVRSQMQANAAPGAIAAPPGAVPQVPGLIPGSPGAAPGPVLPPSPGAENSCTVQVVQIGPPVTVVCLN